MVKKIFAILLLFVFVPMLFGAGTTGKIAGIVTDKQTGEPLPGVNVVIEGTYLGSATDLDGYYVILNVPVGKNNLEAIYVGYQELLIQGVQVSVDLTSAVNIQLDQTTLELSEAIIVTAIQDRIRKDETNTNIISTADDIANMSVRGIQEIASLTAGVVKQENSNNMNVRGGRNTESAVYIDGVLANDPYNKAVRVYIPNEAIEQMSVQTGGFNAEYGEAMSGIVITTTKSGTEKYSGSVQAISDEFLSPTNKEFGLDTYSYGYNEYTGTLSGPIIPGFRHTFHVSGAYRYQADHTPSWGWAENPDKPAGYEGGRIPGNQSNEIAFTGKAKIYLTEKMDLKSSVTWTDRKYADSDNTGFSMSPIWLYNTTHAPEWTQEHRSFNVTFTHAPTSNIFYNAKANYFHTYRENYDRFFEDDVFAYGDPTKNPHVADDAYEPGNQWGRRVDVGSSLDFFEFGNQYDDYFKNQTNYMGFDFDATWQYNKNHTFKGGAGYKYHTMREYRIIEPVKLAASTGLTEIELWRSADVQFYGYDINGNEVDDGDYFSVERDANLDPISGYDKQEPYHPIIIHAFFQDKVEFDDLILNLGLRYDQIDVNAWEFKDQAAEIAADGSIVPGTGMFHGDETFDKNDVVDSEVHHFISPRNSWYWQMHSS